MNYRYDWLTKIINEKGYETIAEVGLNNCETLLCLMEKCPTIKYYLGVDMRMTPPIEECVKKFPSVFSFLKGDSTEIGHSVVNQFDLVFVDADHEYEKVLLDIKAWENKVRSGGILCGDDYNNPNWPGVKKAVDEYFPNVNAVEPPVCVWWINAK